MYTQLNKILNKSFVGEICEKTLLDGLNINFKEIYLEYVDENG